LKKSVTAVSYPFGNAGAPFGCQYTKEVVVVGMKKVLEPPPPRLTRSAAASR